MWRTSTCNWNYIFHFYTLPHCKDFLFMIRNETVINACILVFFCNFCLTSKICTVLTIFFSTIYGKRKKHFFSITKYELAITKSLRTLLHSSCMRVTVLNKQFLTQLFFSTVNFWTSAVTFSNKSLAKIFLRRR